MTKARNWALFFGIVFFSQSLIASTPFLSHVEIKLASSVKTPSAKEPFWLAVQLKMDPGWHINSSEACEGGNPLTLEWSLPKDLKILETVWPEPKMVQHGSIVSRIYEKEIWVLVKLKADVALHQAKVELDVHYVACGDSCMPGNSHLELDFPVETKLISEPDLYYWLQEDRLHQDVNMDFSWVLAIIFAFISGILLNLMPCVLPVLSLKLLSLLHYKGLMRHQLIKHATFFTSGILSSFWLVSGILAILKSQGQQLGWGFQLQSPTFVAFLSVIFLLLAMNMWGVFEIGTSFVGLEDKKLSSRDGLSYFSSFLSGVLACVVASPCSAPFMGTALGVAAIQPFYISFLIFSSLAIGLAFPFIMVCAFPKTIKWLPKPGRWMETLKQVLGFALMATVCWLVWIFGHQKGNDQVGNLLGILLINAVGFWVYGRWSTINYSDLIRKLAVLCMALSLGVSSFLIVSVTSSPLLKSSSVQWEAYSPERLQVLREQGRIVFVDFTAAWCLTCQMNKKIALESETFLKKVEQLGIVVMRANWTNQDSKITAALADYGRNSVPLYVLHQGGEKTPPRILPQILTPNILLDELSKIK
ncbi:MAG: thioredoxin family protein [Alphaproteobacteria bacterium]|nr:thioredoxin family protein [Alphaproteobacteria bacterium]